MFSCLFLAGPIFPAATEIATVTRRIRTMWDYYRTAMHFVDGFGKQEWILILFGALAIGATFMRGFGSRNSY